MHHQRHEIRLLLVMQNGCHNMHTLKLAIRTGVGCNVHEVTYLRRLDNRAAAEKQAKTVLVPKNAVTRIPG